MNEAFQKNIGPLPSFAGAWEATVQQPTVAAYLKRADDAQLGVSSASEQRAADTEKRAKAAEAEAAKALAAAASIAKD
eukprot:6328950-Prymnesium_polylepis.1